MSISEALKKLEGRERNIRFKDLLHICEEFFGEVRINGSHHYFKTPWAGNPRINIQSNKGKAEIYQVKQVIAALKKLQSVGD